MQANDFNLSLCQVGVFTSAVKFSKSKVMQGLMAKFGDTYDGAVVALPSSENVPAEVPQIVLNSSDGMMRLQVARARIDLFVSRKKDDSEIDQGKFLELVGQVLETYKADASATFDRVGVVVNRYCKHESPGQALAKHFCSSKWKDGVMADAEHFELHFHKRGELNSCQVNRWIRFRTGSLVEEETPVVLVVQDINVLPEDTSTKEFSVSDVTAFVKAAWTEQDKALPEFLSGD